MSNAELDFALMVCDLQEKFTLQYIGQEIGVTERQVTNIKNGDTPGGFTAIRLYLFHAKHRTAVPLDRTVVPIADGEKTA